MKATTTKENLMKNQNPHFNKTIPALLTALALTCMFSLTADAGRGEAPQAGGATIVGLWHVQYSGDLEGLESFDQWHRDGQEFEVANAYPGAMCQGTWKPQANGTVKLFHTGWNFDSNGQLVGYFNENQILTVSTDHQTYDGTFVFRDYDVAGNQLDELTGAVHATLLTADTPISPIR